MWTIVILYAKKKYHSLSLFLLHILYLSITVQIYTYIYSNPLASHSFFANFRFYSLTLFQRLGSCYHAKDKVTFFFFYFFTYICIYIYVYTYIFFLLLFVFIKRVNFFFASFIQSFIIIHVNVGDNFYFYLVIRRLSFSENI